MFIHLFQVFKYFGILYKLLKQWICVLVYGHLCACVEHVAVCISITWSVHSKSLFSVYDSWNENFSHCFCFKAAFILCSLSFGGTLAGSRVKLSVWGGKQGEEESQTPCKSPTIFLFLNSSVPQGFDIGARNLARIWPWGLRNAYHC